MVILDTIKQSLQNIPADLQKTAQSAFADVANTYQAVLLQDTGWTVPTDSYNPTQAISQEIAERDNLNDIQQDIEIER